MSGFLDNKSRVMDTIITLEGRRQIAEGKLRIEYVSFTDNATFYDLDLLSGSADPSNRIYVEQTSLMQDRITFEADDSGKIKPFKNASNIIGSLAGNIVYIAQSISSPKLEFLAGSSFASLAEKLLGSSIQNFQSLQVLGTKNYVFEDDDFQSSPEKLKFNVTDQLPLSIAEKTRNINDLPALLFDKSFSNVKNFKYLPPINKVYDKSLNKSSAAVINQNLIGKYDNGEGGVEASDEKKYPYKNLEEDLSLLKSYGFSKTILFDPTSLSNNLVSQIFESTNSALQKLDIVDYGPYVYNNVLKHVFFVGKVLVDDNNCQTFIKMFTLVFE